MILQTVRRPNSSIKSLADGASGTATNGARPPGKEKRSWKAVVHAPEPEHIRRPNGLPWPGVPLPQHPQLGTPSTIFWFEDTNGRTLFGEARFETPEGKGARPLTWCEPDGFRGRPGWHWKGPNKPYPIFNLSRLAAEPDKPRLLTEGARKAIAATSMFPDHVPTAMLFGAESPHLADCQPLAGSVVTIWPDRDEAGAKFVDGAAKRLMADGVTDIRVVDVPEDFPRKWDLADPLPKGVTLERLAELLRSAKPWVAPVKPEPQAAAETQATGDEAEIARLAKLTVPQYERERDAAAKRLGMRVAILDKEVGVARGGVDTTFGGRELALHEPELWPDPVDGAELLDALAEAMRRHVVMSHHEADAAALWVVGTHTFNVWRVFPRLFVTAPEPDCGKSTLLDVLSRLVLKPLIASSSTSAALFRVIEAAGPTLLLDEADAYMRDSEDLRAVIDAGHRQDGAVIRCVGDDFEPRQFSCWAAVALAAIGRLPGTIESRSIIMRLRRRRPDEDIEPLRLDRETGLDDLARKTARWAREHSPALFAADPTMPAGIVNRAADNWRPLLAVADAARGGWPERARRAVVALTHDGAEDAETVRTMLLADIKAAFDAKATDRFPSEEIIAYLTGLDDRPWSEFRGGKAITKVQLAKLLKPLRISSGTIRLDDGKTPKGYYRSTLEDAFARYLSPEKNATTPQAKDSAPFGENRNATSGNGVAFRNPQKPKDAAACGVVADQSRPPGANGNAQPSGGEPWALEI
jgi:Protein of unknown function (DUF3631)